jgi:hypothetical protein
MPTTTFEAGPLPYSTLKIEETKHIKNINICTGGSQTKSDS